MNITVGIVVLFAYLLGLTVFFLDIVYALSDPRIRLGGEGETIRLVAKRASLWSRPRKDRKLVRSQPWNNRAVSSHMKDEDPFKDRLKDRLTSFWTSLRSISSAFREIFHYPTAVLGLLIITLLVAGSILAVTIFPYNELGRLWGSIPAEAPTYIPKYAQPFWVNWFRVDKLPTTLILDTADDSAAKTVRNDSGGMPRVKIVFTFQNMSSTFPQDLTLFFDAKYDKKQPFVALTWITPDGRTYNLSGSSAEHDNRYSLTSDNSIARLALKDSEWQKWYVSPGRNYPTPPFELLYAVPHMSTPTALKGTYQLVLDGYIFEKGSDIDARLVILGQVYGWGGTDYLRRNLLIPLLWGMPFALLIGLVGASVTTLLSMILAAVGVWYGGWIDTLIQRLVEANMILLVIAVCVLLYVYFNVSVWTILWIIVLLNVFGSPIKSYRAALLQIKNAPFIESALAYNSSNGRIIFQYLIPRIMPTLFPQFIAMIPSYVFLEATLGILGVTSSTPTWGSVIYSALRNWGNWGNAFWVLEPIALVLLTGLAFSMVGSALEQILNPRLKDS